MDERIVGPTVFFVAGLLIVILRKQVSAFTVFSHRVFRGRLVTPTENLPIAWAVIGLITMLLGFLDLVRYLLQ